MYLNWIWLVWPTVGFGYRMEMFAHLDGQIRRDSSREHFVPPSPCIRHWRHLTTLCIREMLRPRWKIVANTFQRGEALEVDLQPSRSFEHPAIEFKAANHYSFVRVSRPQPLVLSAMSIRLRSKSGQGSKSSMITVSDAGRRVPLVPHLVFLGLNNAPLCKARDHERP